METPKNSVQFYTHISIRWMGLSKSLGASRSETIGPWKLDRLTINLAWTRLFCHLVPYIECKLNSFLKTGTLDSRGMVAFVSLREHVDRPIIHSVTIATIYQDTHRFKVTKMSVVFILTFAYPKYAIDLGIPESLRNYFQGFLITELGFSIPNVSSTVTFNFFDELDLETMRLFST